MRKFFHSFHSLNGDRLSSRIVTNFYYLIKQTRTFKQRISRRASKVFEIVNQLYEPRMHTRTSNVRLNQAPFGMNSIYSRYRWSLFPREGREDKPRSIQSKERYARYDKDTQTGEHHNTRTEVEKNEKNRKMVHWPSYTPQPRTSNMTGVACMAKRPIPAYTKTLVKTVKIVKPLLQRAIGGDNDKRTICVVVFHLFLGSLIATSRFTRLTRVFVGLFSESFDVLTEPVLPFLHIRKGRTTPSRPPGAGAHVLIVHLQL